MTRKYTNTLRTEKPQSHHNTVSVRRILFSITSKLSVLALRIVRECTFGLMFIDGRIETPRDCLHSEIPTYWDARQERTRTPSPSMTNRLFTIHSLNFERVPIINMAQMGRCYFTLEWTLQSVKGRKYREKEINIYLQVFSRPWLQYLYLLV